MYVVFFVCICYSGYFLGEIQFNGMDLLQTLLLFIKISYQMHQGHAGQDACGHALKSPESLVLVRAESGINPTQF